MSPIQQMLLGAGVKVADDPMYIEDVFNSRAYLGVGDSGTGQIIPTGIKLDHGNYSVDFDGTGDYLTVDGPGALGGSTDFTMECWVYTDTTSGIKRIFSADEANNSDEASMIRTNGTEWQVYIGRNSSSDYWEYKGGSVSTSTWYHVALVRSGSNMYFFVDGAVQASSTGSHGTTFTKLVVGGGYSTERFDGKISNARFTKGQALYTSAFTSPTEALTLSSQGASAAKITLLCCNTALITGGSIVANQKEITASGDPTSSTSSPFATDSSTYGGLVISKVRTQTYVWGWTDTQKGVNKYISSNNRNATTTTTGIDQGITAFANGGITVGKDSAPGIINYSGSGGDGDDYIAYTFKRNKKFFDCVSWTGDGNASKTIPHILGSVPGAIMAKNTKTGNTDWFIYHRGLDTSSPEDYHLHFNNDARSDAGSPWNDTAPTSSNFTAGTDINALDETYVAYVFAHDAGGFGANAAGESSDQSIIKCGVYTGDGSSDGSTLLDLGFEPAFFVVKSSEGTSQEWFVFDDLRGLRRSGALTGEAVQLYFDEYAVETGANSFGVRSAGVTFWNSNAAFNGNGNKYVYIAVAKETGKLMRAPSSPYDVFAMDTGNNSGTLPNFDSNFPVDIGLIKKPAASGSWYLSTRLTGKGYVRTDTNDDFDAGSDRTFDSSTGWAIGSGYASHWQSWMWKRSRACDVVVFKGTDNAHLENHSLGVVPKFIILKNLDTDSNAWYLYHASANSGTNPEDYYFQWGVYEAGATIGATSDSDGVRFNSTAPTATTFSVGTSSAINKDGDNIIAYLFTDVLGISIMGEYTGTGSDTDTDYVDVGFQPRFIIIKRSDAASDWWIMDSLRGMGSGNDYILDPTLPASQNESLDVITISSAGFGLKGSSFNVSSGKYIYYAHA